MPRRSAASLAVLPVADPARTPLRPRADMPEDVKEAFRELIASAPKEHFRRSDAPLLEAYAGAIIMARKAYIAIEAEGAIDQFGKASPWISVHEKAVRAVVALSARLRLSVQHRVDPKVTGRATGSPSTYEMME